MIELPEAIQLGAKDGNFFGRYFFPKTSRQKPPEFHKQIDYYLDSQAHRGVAIKIFRGSAKTSKLRMYGARRISYGLSNTVVYVGKSQDAAVNSLAWLQNRMEDSPQWTHAFGLRKGSKWSGTQIEIVNEKMEMSTTVLAVGITGAIRGFNFDDYRPDLIICDDLNDEENSATPEQREKMNDRFFGALWNSLAPPIDNPFAKMVFLQTPLDEDDLLGECGRRKAFTTISISALTPENKSVWEDRIPTKELLLEKEDAIASGQAHIWYREMEVSIVSKDTSDFAADKVKFWETLPEGGATILVVDPTPPPKGDEKKQRSNRNLDDTCLMVLRLFDWKVYVAEIRYIKSPLPQEIYTAIFELRNSWQPISLVRIETVLFARYVAEGLRTEMKAQKEFFVLDQVEDKRPKPIRIRDELGTLLQNGQLYIHASHSTLYERIRKYPMVNHDDDLDALSLGLTKLSEGYRAAKGNQDVFEEEYEQQSGEWRACP